MYTNFLGLTLMTHVINVPKILWSKFLKYLSQSLQHHINYYHKPYLFIHVIKWHSLTLWIIKDYQPLLNLTEIKVNYNSLSRTRDGYRISALYIVSKKKYSYSQGTIKEIFFWDTLWVTWNLNHNLFTLS